MKNSADLGGCYPTRPSASVDNTLLDLQNSSYPTRPHSIIAKYQPSIIFARARLAQAYYVTEYVPAKTGDIHVSEWYSPIFKTAPVAKKIEPYQTHIFLGHNLFLESHKLFATRKHAHPRTNIWAYFRAKWGHCSFSPCPTNNSSILFSTKRKIYPYLWLFFNKGS